jgi:hypothetical protein
MNKIKELAERAGLAEAADVRGGYIYPIGMEQFAKLIMEECISACATDALGKTKGAEELIRARLGLTA